MDDSMDARTWKETTRQQRNLELFHEEFDDFLPATILDFHVHVCNPGVVPTDTPFSCSGHPLLSYTLDELAADLAATYPQRKTLAVCFGLPEVGYDRARNNNYLAQACDRERFFPLRLFDPTKDTPATLAQDLTAGRFFGIKPYPNYARKAAVTQVEIADMLPDWALEVIDSLGLIVMLHIPRPGRLADPLNQQQIVRLCRRFPRAKIVLAHIGRAYYLKNVRGNLDPLKDLPNLYFDMAMVNHWEVLEHAFATLPADRFLYGTDIPLALAPGKSVEINDQYTYITPVPWSLAICDAQGRIRFTSFVYEELRAIKKAVARVGLGDDFLQGLFYDNGMRLLSGAGCK
jgi:hypothetical protein